MAANLATCVVLYSNYMILGMPKLADGFVMSVCVC
jgi:hypothetical protein